MVVPTIAALALAATFGAPAFGHMFVRPPGAIVEALDVPKGLIVFARSSVATETGRPSSAALVLAVSSSNDARRDGERTGALARLVRSVVGVTTVSTQPPEATPTLRARYAGGPPYAGYVRVVVPGDDDARLIGTLDRVLAAIDAQPFADPLASASLVRVDSSFRTCSSLALDLGSSIDALHDDARTAAASDADLRSMPIVRSAALAGGDAAPPTCSDAPVGAWPNVDTQPPTTAALSRSYRIDAAQPMRTIHVAARASGVFPAGNGGPGWPRLRLVDRVPLLVVEGFARNEPRPTGDRRYVYAASSFRPDEAAATLVAIRHRLHALGIGDGDVVAQLTPTTRAPWVEVRTRARVAPLAVAHALDDGDPGGLATVTSAEDDDSCHGEPVAAVRAIADAAARAARFAARIGATIYARPVAVSLESTAVADPCRNPIMLPIPTTLPGARSVAGPTGAFATRAVAVAFRIRSLPKLRATAALQSSDVPSPTAPEFDSSPIDVAEQTASLVSATSLDLAPQALRVSIDASPDDAHAFRAIDAGLAVDLGRDLNVGSGEYAAAFLPNSLSIEAGRAPPILRFEANVPYVRASSTAALLKARDAAIAVAYAPLAVTTEAPQCSRAADDALADAGRDALAKLQNVRDARLVVIDVRGPTVVTGACGSAGDGIPAYVVRSIPPLVVTLAASVRISYTTARQ